jgi:hypothetical protein
LIIFSNEPYFFEAGLKGANAYATGVSAGHLFPFQFGGAGHIDEADGDDGLFGEEPADKDWQQRADHTSRTKDCE